MKYEVLKGFVNYEINATKGKIIEIKNKELASSLLEAGYISVVTKKEVSFKEKEEEIKKLSTELAQKEVENQKLQIQIAELEEKLRNLENVDNEISNNSGDSNNKVNEDDNTLDNSAKESQDKTE